MPHEPNQLTVVRPTWLFDSAQGHVVEGMDVAIEGSQISAVLPRVQPPPAGAVVFEAPGCCLLPGLIDLHVQVFSWGRVPGAPESRVANVLRGVRNVERLLARGVTTIRDVGAGDGLALELRREILGGLVSGPDIVSCGTPIGADGRHAYLYSYAPVTGPDEARRAARTQIRSGAPWINLAVTAGLAGGGGNFAGAPGWQELAADEIQAVAHEARRAGVRVMANAIGAAGARAAVDAGVDCVDHGTFLDPPTIERMAERGTGLVPTAGVIRFFIEHGRDLGLDHRIINAAREAQEALRTVVVHAHRAGVVIGTGTDAHGDDSVATEIAALVEAGMPAQRALQAGTLSASKILGLEDRGRVAAGQRADLLLVRGNPAADVKALLNVVHVWKEGSAVLSSSVALTEGAA